MTLPVLLIAGLNCSIHTLYPKGHHELVIITLTVIIFDTCFGTGSFRSLASGHYHIGLFYSVPTLISIHTIISTTNRSNLTKF